MPRFLKNSFRLPNKNDLALSECTHCGIPHKLKSLFKQLITVEEYISGHGKAKENLEYSSIITSKYLLLEALCKGPLKSKLILSKGLVALMSDSLQAYKKMV